MDKLCVELFPPKTYIGPLVKRLRHRPFTAVTRVRIPYGSPFFKEGMLNTQRPVATHALALYAPED